MKIGLFFLWHLSSCLRVYAIDSLPPLPAPQYDEAADNGTLGFYPKQSYVTFNMTSPKTNFLTWNEQCDDGLMTFVTPRGWSLQKEPGPMILDNRGELVWTHHYDNVFGGEGYNLLVQNYQGEDYLTFWLGDDRVKGHGSGAYYLLNSSYDIVHKVEAANGLAADLHEFLITTEGTALMSIYDIIPGDVSMFRNFDATKNPDDADPNYIWDGVFQEINIETNELLFEWRASEHVPITDTYRPIYSMGTRSDPFDWFHINSVEKDELGNYIVSARYPHVILYIDGQTKETLWTLGGKGNDFMDMSEGNATNFAWQHDARFVSVDQVSNVYQPPPKREGFTTKLVSLFDNAAEDRHYQYGLPLSRGLLLEVTFPTPGSAKALAGASKAAAETKPSTEGVIPQVAKMLTINGTDPDYMVRVIKSYDSPDLVRSSSQGSMQVVPQGSDRDAKVLVGYGLNAAWTEFDSNGTVLCDVHWAASTSWERGDMQSYRTYKFPWTGRPRWNPAVQLSDDDAEVYVSWLGATDVREWVLQCSQKLSDNDQDWSDLSRVQKQDFETSLSVPPGVRDARYLRVIALAESDRRLDYGTSKVLDRGIVATYLPASVNTALPPRVAHASPLKGFAIVMCVVSAAFVLYEAYRRWLSYRLGTPSAGVFRWRKGPGYRLLGNTDNVV